MYVRMIEEDLGADTGKAILEHALGVDPGYLKRKIDEIGNDVKGIELLLWLAAAGGVAAAVVTIVGLKKR
jgi:hypothetical protein